MLLHLHLRFAASACPLNVVFLKPIRAQKITRQVRLAQFPDQISELALLPPEWLVLDCLLTTWIRLRMLPPISPPVKRTSFPFAYLPEMRIDPW